MAGIVQPVPVRWFKKNENFGDYLAPWLVEKITQKPVVYGKSKERHFLTIGSILQIATPKSIVWGTGAFGTETKDLLCPSAEYLAVRGPLARNKLEIHGIKCPRIYGDPALLVPDFYNPDIKPTHELGIIVRWSEDKWHRQFSIDGVKEIFFGTSNVEDTLDEILSCKKILSSSLHGLIIADAYGIPNAWLSSGSPKGREFKYWDYFCSVHKLREPQVYDVANPGLTLQNFMENIRFDGREIKINLDLLRGACPFGYD